MNRLRLVLAATALAGVVSGCAGPSTSGPEAEARAFAKAWSAQDGAAVCATLAPKTRDEVAKSAANPCSAAILDEDLPDPGSLAATQLWGRSAQVRLANDTLFLAEFPAGWRVVAAGCVAQPGEPYDCQVEGS